MLKVEAGVQRRNWRRLLKTEVGVHRENCRKREARRKACGRNEVQLQIQNFEIFIDLVKQFIIDTLIRSLLEGMSLLQKRHTQMDRFKRYLSLRSAKTDKILVHFIIPLFKHDGVWTTSESGVYIVRNRALGLPRSDHKRGNARHQWIARALLPVPRLGCFRRPSSFDCFL